MNSDEKHQVTMLEIYVEIVFHWVQLVTDNVQESYEILKSSFSVEYLRVQGLFALVKKGIEQH